MAFRVTVGTEHLWDTLCYREEDQTFKTAVDNLRDRLQEACTFGPDEPLEDETVFSLVEKFHEQFVKLLDEPQIKDKTLQLQQEVQETGRTVYNYPGFSTTREQAVQSLAMHELFPHGSIDEKGVFLPDYMQDVRFYGVFLQERDPGKGPVPLKTELRYCRQELLEFLPRVECHLCDRLADVYQRAKECQDWLKQQANNETAKSLLSRAAACEETLRIHILSEGFAGYRLLRHVYRHVPSVGSHRLLSAGAVRWGIGRRTVSRVFPVRMWQDHDFSKPVKHFLLKAAEQIGQQDCRVIYPSTPSREQLEDLQ